MMVSGVDPATCDLGVTVIVFLADAVCVGLLLSVTITVKVAVAALVGVPEIVPVDGVRTSPAGKLPELIDHV
jgi:hypothetical protein